MAAITHRHDEFHRGLVPEDQLADDTPTAGFVVTATGGGEAEWAPAASAPITSWKTPVRAATVAAGTLATAYENGDTIDGVVLATGDRILLKDQASAPANGVYTVNASGAPTRATDFDTSAEALGAVVLVLEGTENADRAFMLTSDAPFTIGPDSLDFAELSGIPDIESLLTTETDPTLVLGPDGSGGVEFRPEAAGIGTLNFIIDGGGSAITTGVKGDLMVHYAGTITEWEALADQSGSIVVDIWRDTYANFPPVVGDSITGAEKPTISAALKGQDTSLAAGGWAVAADDILRFNVDSITTCQRVTIALKFVRA